MKSAERSRESSGASARDESEKLNLFVYGTLKRGQRNHDLFCRDVRSLRDAQLRGRLYDGLGIPLIEVPEEDILALGTARPGDDLATQIRIARQVQSLRLPANVGSESAWGTVQGKLLRFGDPESNLPVIDWNRSTRGIEAGTGVS